MGGKRGRGEGDEKGVEGGEEGRDGGKVGGAVVRRACLWEEGGVAVVRRVIKHEVKRQENHYYQKLIIRSDLK